MSKYIDIHTHTNFIIFDEDRSGVIKRALDNNTWLVNIGTQYDTSKKAVEITKEYKEGVYSCIGLHPIHTSKSYHDQDELGDKGKEFTSRGEIFDKGKYRELAKEGKVIGIGECGLDYYHLSEQKDLSSESLEKQRKAFIDQIELANELNLPLMLHIRNSDKDLKINAYQDVLQILKEYAKVKGVVHFFAGTLKDAKDFIDFGFYVSFAGVITYLPKKNDNRSVDYENIVRELPLDKIMVDTDSPYVAPVPHRGHRNEPVYVRDIVEKIAEIKGISLDEMAKIVFSNAKKLFDI